MSWQVRDDEWLAPIEAVPELGPIDEFDAHMVGELVGHPTAAARPEVLVAPAAAAPVAFVAPAPAPVSEPAPASTTPPLDSTVAEFASRPTRPELPALEPPSGWGDGPAEMDDGVPPPPPSAAFDHEGPTPSYESGRFMVEPNEDDVDRSDELVGVSIPLLARPEPVTASGTGLFGFVIPSLRRETVSEAPDPDSEPVVIPMLAREPVADGPPTESVDEVLAVTDSQLEVTLEPERTDEAGRLDSEPVEEASFVIPPLASAVGGISPAEIMLPLLALAARDADDDSEEPIDDAEDLEVVEVEEQGVVMGAVADGAEPRPPSPPTAPPAEKRRKAWYDDVFVDHYQFLYPTTWDETVRRDAEFVHAVLDLPGGSTLMDVGCGDGRHALELGKLGLRVTGLDNSLALLLAAGQYKEQAGLADEQVAFLHGDMRRLPRDRLFDAVICIGTTLGYFEEEQNRACLEEMVERLSPTGRLLVHVFNRDFVAPQLPARSWWQGRRCMVLDEAEMNFFANRLRVHRTVIFDDGRQFEHYMFMRAFTVHDLGKALSQLGMRVVEVSGSRDTRGRFYGAGSPDIWIMAERKT